MRQKIVKKEAAISKNVLKIKGKTVLCFYSLHFIPGSEVLSFLASVCGRELFYSLAQKLQKISGVLRQKGFCICMGFALFVFCAIYG